MISLKILKINILRIKFNMENINQKVYAINNIPATNYGEWPGIIPNKWKGSIKIIRPHTTNLFNIGK
jgi:hypothetical protein